jgi:hypothetical protein
MLPTGRVRSDQFVSLKLEWEVEDGGVRRSSKNLSCQSLQLCNGKAVTAKADSRVVSAVAEMETPQPCRAGCGYTPPQCRALAADA